MGVSLHDTSRQPATNVPDTNGAPGGNRRRIVLLAIVGVMLLALLAGLGVLDLTRQSQSPKGTTPAIQPAGPITAIVTGHVLLDTSGGWKDVTPARFGVSDPVAAQFLTATLGWAVDVQVIGKTTKDFIAYHSTDGGTTWKSVTVPWLDEGGADWAQVQFVDAQHGSVSIGLGEQTSRRPGFLYTTSDGGATWTKHELPFGGAIQFSDPTTGLVIGGGLRTAHNLIDLTRDGGTSWQAETLIPPTGLELSDRYISTPAFVRQNGIMAVNYGTEAAFYTSEDGGVSWLASATFPVATPAREMEPVVSLWGTNGWALVGSALYASHDGGKSWAAVHTSRDLTSVQALGVTTGSGGWAVAGGTTLLVTTDGGVTWRVAK